MNIFIHTHIFVLSWLPPYDEFIVMELPGQRELAFTIMINMAKLQKSKNLHQFIFYSAWESAFFILSPALDRVSTFYLYQVDRQKKKRGKKISLILLVFFAS